MLENERDYIALFIDWDNMAISIAADMGGANVDLRRIVSQAQSYGTILVARAYAEWSSTTERLNVYKLGVDPIYAPTFRFEPDPVTGSRSKSLADPVMVTDCIDLLHTMPHVNTYLIVSGDKDLIPVVRLAQLRGKRVIVIGPDYVAGVLRDMADEYVPYRRLLENGEPARTAEPIEAAPPAPARRTSRATSTQSGSSNGSNRTNQRAQQAPRTQQPAAQPASSGSSTNSRNNRTNEPYIATLPPAATLPPIQATESFEEPAFEEEPIAEEPVASANANNDVQSIFDLMADILREKLNEGRARLRATNLKDILMARIPGFSERRYGFTKFKDLLAAAEKSGVLTVSMNGPVHWVALATPETTTAEPAAQEETAGESDSESLHEELSPESQPAVSRNEEATLEVAPDAAGVDHARRVDIIRFINELRQRSQFMTKNYTLTSLTSYLNQSMPQAQAEIAAREILTELINSGALEEDREPQEIQVGPNKHRLRMCHLNLSHPLVLEALAQPATEQARPGIQAEEASVPAIAEPVESAETAESSNEAEAVSEQPEAEAAASGLRRRRRRSRTPRSSANKSAENEEVVSPENMEALVSEILQMRAATPETTSFEETQAEEAAVTADEPTIIQLPPPTDRESGQPHSRAAREDERAVEAESEPAAETTITEIITPEPNPTTNLGEESEPFVAAMSFAPDEGQRAIATELPTYGTEQESMVLEPATPETENGRDQPTSTQEHEPVATNETDGAEQPATTQHFQDQAE